MAVAKGRVLLAPAPIDRAPRRIGPHERNAAARRANAAAVLALADCIDGELPIDVELGFYDLVEGQLGALELRVGSSLRNDGGRTDVQLFFVDADLLVQAVRKHGALLNVVDLTQFLANVWPFTSRIHVSTPSLHLDVSEAMARARDRASRPRPRRMRRPCCLMAKVGRLARLWKKG